MKNLYALTLLALRNIRWRVLDIPQDLTCLWEDRLILLQLWEILDQPVVQVIITGVEVAPVAELRPELQRLAGALESCGIPVQVEGHPGMLGNDGSVLLKVGEGIQDQEIAGW